MNLIAALERRVSELEPFCRERRELLEKQAHLDEGSIERAYWHYGYLAALKDIQHMWEKS